MESIKATKNKRAILLLTIAIHIIFLAAFLYPSNELNPSLHLSNAIVPHNFTAIDVSLVSLPTEKSPYENLRFPSFRFVIDEKHSLAYCPIFKNLSTRFKELIFWLIKSKGNSVKNLAIL